MGEMCDFMNEYPGLWRSLEPKYKKSSVRVMYTISLSKKQREKVRLLGGAVAIRKLIEQAPLPDQKSD